MRRVLATALLLTLTGATARAAECNFPSADAMFPLGRPSAGSVAREFGLTYDEKLQKKTQYGGVDFEAVPGEPVYAAQGGVVVEAGRHAVWGTYVRIDHGASVLTGYGHLGQTSLQAGQCIAPGEEIGKTGASGNQGAPRLYFEVLRSGAPADPLPLLPQ